MVIRRACVDDAAELAAFADRSFRETFAADNNAADMEAYCAEAFSPAAQRDALADRSIETLICVDEAGRIAGYAQLRPGEPDGVVRPAPLELWRFYVDRMHHGRGVARQLMAAVFAAARGRSAQTLWLGVWEKNLRALAFYRKFGFVDVGSHQFVLGTDVQTDRLMVCDIT